LCAALLLYYNLNQLVNQPTQLASKYMSETIVKRPPQTSVQLQPAARAALDRIKQQHGVNKSIAIERGIFIYENHLNNGAATFAKIKKSCK